MKSWLRGVQTVLLALACAAAGGTAARAQGAAPPQAPAAQETPPDQAPGAPEVTAQSYSLSLADVLKSALENNLDISVRRIDPKSAETQIEIQEAVFSPILNFSAKDSQSTTPQGEALAGGSVVTQSNWSFLGRYTDPVKIGGTFDFQLIANRGSTTSNLATINPSYFVEALATYTQPFLRNFGLDVNKTQITIAQNTREISRWGFKQTVMDTLAAAEEAYYDLNLAIMNKKTADAYLKLAQDFLGQTKIRVKVGTLPPIEITQAEAGVADREEAVILARSVIALAEDNLRRLMNIPADSPLWKQTIEPTEEPQVLEKTVNLDEAIQTAMQHRPDLEQAHLDLASRDADLHYRKNQRLYRLDLIAQYGAQGLAGDTFSVDFSQVPPVAIPVTSTGFSDAFSQVGRRDFDTWSAELQLGIPLGNRAATAAYTASEYDQERSKLTIQQLEQAAQVQVRTVVRNIDTDLQRFKAAQVNTKLQKEKLEAEQKKYENGMSTTYQILQFQSDLANAKARENQSIVDYNKSLVELDRVLGILLDTHNVTVAE
jgi:outer membrane protein